MPKYIIKWEDEEIDGCDMEGCRGHAVMIRWPNGEETLECSAFLDGYPESNGFPPEKTP